MRPPGHGVACTAERLRGDIYGPEYCVPFQYTYCNGRAVPGSLSVSASLPGGWAGARVVFVPESSLSSTTLAISINFVIVSAIT